MHFLFDLLALAAGWFSSVRFRSSLNSTDRSPLPPSHLHGYLLIIIIGLVAGSIFFGSLNLWLAGKTAAAKSVIGGLFGAILAAEIYKLKAGIQGSTGLVFIPGLTVGIIIGRVGCFLAGIDDFTYGTPTQLFLGVDFGDHIKRHPVQLYESFTMLLFLLIFLHSFRNNRQFWLDKGFYIFVLVYAGQRFIWEFLKPYPEVLSVFNVFHLLALLLILYSLFMLTKASTHAE